MADVQLENGYVSVANQIMDAIVAHEFTGREFRIILSVMRLTYGFNKSTARIEPQQIMNMTGLSKSTVYDSLRRLITRQVLSIKDNEIGLNKDYDRWQIDNRLPRPKESAISEKIPEPRTHALHQPLKNH